MEPESDVDVPNGVLKSRKVKITFQKCNDHPSRRLKIVCATCNHLCVCSTCAKIYHSGHKVRQRGRSGCTQSAESTTELLSKSTTQTLSNIASKSGKLINISESAPMFGAQKQTHKCDFARERKYNEVFESCAETDELSSDSDSEVNLDILKGLESVLHNKHDNLTIDKETVFHIKSINNIKERLKLVQDKKIRIKMATNDGIESIKKHAVNFKAKVDDIVNRLENQMRHFELIKMQELLLYETSLLDQNNTSGQVNSLNSGETSSMNIDTDEHISKNYDKSEILENNEKVARKLSIHFVPRESSSKEIEQLFGIVETTEISRMSSLTKSMSSTSSLTADDSELYRFDLDERNVVRSLCSISTDSSWVVHETSTVTCPDVDLVSTNGKVEASIKFGAGVLDISRDYGDETVLVSCTDNTVWQIIEHATIMMFKTTYRPESICSLKESAVVICFHQRNKLVKVNRKGTLLFAMEGNADNHISFPYKIRSNNVHDRMAVLNSKPYSLLVLNDKFDTVFTFNGKTTYAGTFGTLKQTDDLRIGPNDVTFDPEDNLILADVVSKSVILLSKTGQVLRNLIPGTHYPSSLTFDLLGHLWVGFYNGAVKVLEYN